MNVYLSKTYSDEDDDLPLETGKLAIICGSKNEILKLCKFFRSVEQHLNENENCHMHLRDYFSKWDRNSDIDIEINAEE